MDQHPRMRRMHPFLFQEVYGHKMDTDLCSEGREKSVHSPIKSTSDFDVSLHGGIPPGRPPDWKTIKDICQHGAPFIELAKEGAFQGASIVQRTFDGFKGGVINFLVWSLPSPTQLFVLKDDDLEIYDDMSMVSKGYSIYSEQQMILPDMMILNKTRGY